MILSNQSRIYLFSFFFVNLSSNGTYCHFLPRPNTWNFNCSDQCTVEYYTIAHNSSVASKGFNYYYLVDMGNEDDLTAGYESVMACGEAMASTRSAPETTETVTAAAASVVTGSKTGTRTGTSQSSASGTAKATAAVAVASATPTGSGNAVKAVMGLGVLYLHLVYLYVFCIA